MKIGSSWEIKNYNLYKNNGLGKLEKMKAGPFSLKYEVTDMKKSNVKNFYILALKINWKYNLDKAE